MRQTWDLFETSVLIKEYLSYCFQREFNDKIKKVNHRQSLLGFIFGSFSLNVGSKIFPENLAHSVFINYGLLVAGNKSEIPRSHFLKEKSGKRQASRHTSKGEKSYSVGAQNRAMTFQFLKKFNGSKV